MKTIQKINKIALFATIGLYMTIFLGLYAQIVLGVLQLFIALYIIKKIPFLNQNLKSQFIKYWIFVGLYFILSVSIYNEFINITNNSFLLVIITIIIPMGLAIYFTITLNKITNYLSIINHENIN